MSKEDLEVEHQLTISDRIRAQAVDLIAPGMNSVFVQDFDGFVVAVEQKIARIGEFQKDKPVDIAFIINDSLETWQREKIKVFTYGRYAKCMEEQDKGQKPLGFKDFLTRIQGKEATSAYDRWCDIERRHIKAVTRLRVKDHPEETWAAPVLSVARDCRLVIRSDGEATTSAASSLTYDIVDSE